MLPVSVLGDTATAQDSSAADYIVGAIVVAAIVILIVWLTKRSNKKRLAQDWSGTVEKRWLASYTDEDGEVTKTPTIQVQIDGGKKKKFSISDATYNSLKEGDKVKKSAGQKDPVKV